MNASTRVDRSDARSTATAALKAYQSRDVIALAGLVVPNNRQIFIELAGQGKQHPRYNSIFSGWRWQLVQSWNGNIGKVHYRHNVGSAVDNYVAVVKFADMGPDEISVVTLDWGDGQWWFEDIHSPSRAEFDKGRPAFSLEPAPY